MCNLLPPSFLISHQDAYRIGVFQILLKMLEYKQEQHLGVSEPNLRKYLTAWFEILNMNSGFLFLWFEYK